MAEKHERHDDGSYSADPTPGRADDGRTGGMATREVAPDVVKRSDDSAE